MENFIDKLGRIIFVVSTVYTSLKFIFWFTVACMVIYWAIRNWSTVILMKDKFLRALMSTTTTVDQAQHTADEIINLVQNISSDAPELIQKVNDQLDALKKMNIEAAVANIETAAADIAAMRAKIESIDNKLDQIKNKLDI